MKSLPRGTPVVLRGRHCYHVVIWKTERFSGSFCPDKLLMRKPAAGWLFGPPVWGAAGFDSTGSSTLQRRDLMRRTSAEDKQQDQRSLQTHWMVTQTSSYCLQHSAFYFICCLLQRGEGCLWTPWKHSAWINALESSLARGSLVWLQLSTHPCYFIMRTLSMK